MEYREFGKCGFSVSVLGFGAGHIGGAELDDRLAGRILNEALDLGINLIDTARSYGLSEERIGKHIAHRRNEFILSTKGGYTYRDVPDWTFEATLGGIEESLVRMKTDRLDIIHLHSCDRQILERGEVIAALEKAREQGKIRVIAYSGENEALDFAIRSGRFGSIQCSINLFDQGSIRRSLPDAKKAEMGVIAKRPLCNAVWRYAERPDGHGHAAYYDRFHALKPDPAGLPWHETALRFAAFTPGVSTVIAGSADPIHLRSNLGCLEKGALPPELYQQFRTAFDTAGAGWEGLI